MVRNDESPFLLYMEPEAKEKTSVSIDDSWTILMEKAMAESRTGVANYSGIGDEPFFQEKNGWKGFHGTACGERSSNHDYELKNGMITNSLSVFYLKHYRNSISDMDWIKLRQLRDFYNKS